MKLKLFFASILFSVSVISQSNPWDNPSDMNFDNDILYHNMPLSPTCGYSSTFYNNYYNRYIMYKDHYEIHPTVTIMLNFIIWQKNDGSENWQNNPNHINRLQNIVNEITNHYQHIALPSDPIPGVIHCYDSKIKFELNGVYFYKNSNCWESSNFELLNSTALSNNPSLKNQINIHITGANATISGLATMPTTDMNQVIQIVTFNNEANENSDAGFVCHLSHELGHCLGLLHTYNGGGANVICDITNPDFLSDLFGTGDNFNCPQDTGWGCDPFSSENTCSNNMLGGTSSSLYLSPMQIQSMHRTLSLKSTRKYVKCESYNTENYIDISSNEVWDFNIKFYNSIRIKSGNTLTIKCKVVMSPNMKIIVEQGAKLIVDGGIITTECSNLWSGIEVWGTDNKSQTQLNSQGIKYQGCIEIKNGAIIENAKVGIQAWNPGTWNNGGGIIMVSDATIRNCEKGVHFGSYKKYNNLSYFRNSIFETTADLLDGSYPKSFIDGWLVKNVIVNGCTFRNTNPNANSINKLGKGIYLESAKFLVYGLTIGNVTDFCDESNTNWKPNIFENLYKGIELVNFGMQQTNGIFTTSISRNLFKNCIYGIECNGMPAVSINQNKIILGGNQLYNIYNEGIVHKSYTGFSISENCISQIDRNATFTGGIIVSNVGGDNNTVYKNKSINVDFGYLSNGKNRTSSVTNQKFKGLQFLCNNNFGSQLYDIAVEGDGQSTLNPMNGIRYYQGGIGNSNNTFDAGNTFTHNCQTNDNDIFNNTINPFVYFYSNGSQLNPICYSWNISPSYTNNLNTCASKIGFQNSTGILDHFQKSLLLSKFAIINSQYLALAMMYNNVIDNGNTESLLQSISASLPTNIGELQDLMIYNSPNLSDLVVQDLIKECTILQNSDLLSIIASNPDVAHNEELLQMLKNKINPMDEWMIEFLREAGTFETNRTLLEQEFSQKQFEREDIIWELVRNILSDSISDSINHTELREWLEMIGSPRAKYMIAEDLVSIGDYNAAINLLNEIQEKDLDRYEISELQGMKDWLGLQIILNNDGRSIYEMTYAELNSIRPLAENEKMNGLAGTFALNVINHFEPESHLNVNTYPDINNREVLKFHTKRTLKKQIINTNNSSCDFLIYPNPANKNISIELNESNNGGCLKIYNQEGQMVIKHDISNQKKLNLNVSDLDNGNYILQLMDRKGEIINTEKLVIINE